MTSTFDQPAVDPRNFDSPHEVCMTCGDDLKANEPRECSECEGDRLAATPCVRCHQPCADREPPMSADGPLCPVCFSDLF